MKTKRENCSSPTVPKLHLDQMLVVVVLVVEEVVEEVEVVPMDDEYDVEDSRTVVAFE